MSTRKSIKTQLAEQGRTVTVGIPGFLNSEKMFGVTGNYMKFASEIGNVRIIMPHEDLVGVDLLLLPGGLDLKPSSYNAIPDYQAGNHDVFKQFFFEEKLQSYLDAEIPTFGICLGYQMLNVKLGGTLKQHLLFHEQSRDRWATAHEVELTGFVFQSGKEKGKPFRMKVNSHHHQAVTTDTLAENLEVLAYSKDGFDGDIVEAFEHPTRPIAGVQWHPEELYDLLSEVMIKKLLSVE